jgi:mRNA interferase MazF
VAAWTVDAGAGYAGKPRPVVIVQDVAFDGTDSVTICAFTSDPTDAPLFRLWVEVSDTNGLDASSRLMADKLTTVRRSKMGRKIGRLDVEDIVRLNRAILVFLGLASSARGE